VKWGGWGGVGWFSKSMEVAPLNWPLSTAKTGSAKTTISYLSQLTRRPLYSMPHLSFTTTGLPIKTSLRKGVGFTISTLDIVAI